MNILFLGDLHLEFTDYRWKIPEVENEKEVVLILGGDISLAKQRNWFFVWLEETAPRFKHVIYYPGNHEFYNGVFPDEWHALVSLVKEGGFPNVTVGNNEAVCIEDVKFIFGTMWARPSPPTFWAGRHSMNDFQLIRTGPDYHKFSPQDYVNEHMKWVNWFEDELSKCSLTDKVFVATHHAPTYEAVQERFKGEALNEFYASNILERKSHTDNFQKINVWAFGHLHHEWFEVDVNGIQVVSQSIGYPYQWEQRKEKLRLIEL